MAVLISLGGKSGADGFLIARWIQRTTPRLRLYGTKVGLTGYVPADFRTDRSAKPEPRRGSEQSLVVTAKVSPLERGRPAPTGTVTFFVDGVPMRRPFEVDADGSVRVTLGPMKIGEHKIRAYLLEWWEGTTTTPVRVPISSTWWARTEK